MAGFKKHIERERKLLNNKGHGKFFNGNKIIIKIWNIKGIFKNEEWQKRNITMSNYWDECHWQQ